MYILRFIQLQVQDNICYSLLLAGCYALHYKYTITLQDVKSDYIKCQEYLYEVFISDFAT